MLHRSGPFDEDELITALKGDLPLYGKVEKEACEIPYREMNTGKVMMAVFFWLGGNWVFIQVRERK